MGAQVTAPLLSEPTVDQKFPLGALHIDENGDHFRYVQADTTALTANLIYTLDDSWDAAAALTTTVAASGECHRLCIAPVAFTLDYYGWVFVGPGQATVTTTGAVTAQAKLFTTATAGKVDDNSSSTVLIPGLVCYTAVSTAGTGTAIASLPLYVSN